MQNAQIFWSNIKFCHFNNFHLDTSFEQSLILQQACNTTGISVDFLCWYASKIHSNFSQNNLYKLLALDSIDEYDRKIHIHNIAKFIEEEKYYLPYTQGVYRVTNLKLKDDLRDYKFWLKVSRGELRRKLKGDWLNHNTNLISLKQRLNFYKASKYYRQFILEYNQYYLL